MNQLFRVCTFILWGVTLWAGERVSSEGALDHPEGLHFRVYDGEDHARNPLPRDIERLPREVLEPLADKAEGWISWSGSIDGALAQAKERNRPVVQIVRDADLRSVLPFAQSTLGLLRSRFVAVWGDRSEGDQRRARQPARKGPQGEEALDAYTSNRMGMGWWVFLDPEGKELWRTEPLAAYSEALLNEILFEFLRRHPEWDRPDSGREPEATKSEYVKAEALCRLADLAWIQKKEQEAIRFWKEVVIKYPDSRYASEAALALLGEHALLHNREELRPLDRWFRGFGRGATDPSRRGGEGDLKEEATRIAREGVAHLVRWQRSDGRWTDLSFSWRFDPQADRANTQFAVTALCARALRGWRALGVEGVEEALERTERVLRDPGYLSSFPFMKVYAYTYALDYWLQAAHDSEGGRRKEALELAARWIPRLVELQGAGGGWASIYSATFTTAPVLGVLAEAKRMGLEVPERPLREGLLGLLKVRTRNGTFGYKIRGPSVAWEGNSPEGSAARNPLCEWACFGVGGSDMERLEGALENFMRHRVLIEKERHQWGTHNRENHTIAPYYHLHGHYYASVVLKMLPEGPRRAEWREALLQAMVSCTEIDGSYVDLLCLGKSYGTAMGLLTLRNLMEM
jgi:hypothetical protein